MNLILKRDPTILIPQGIFGDLRLAGLPHVPYLNTLERTFDGKPKIPQGSYLCRRGMHRLLHSPEPFEAFEVKGIENHTDLLFHVGNYPHDSEGCILLGRDILNKVELISSRDAFRIFMSLQQGLNQFTLYVE